MLHFHIFKGHIYVIYDFLTFAFWNLTIRNSSFVWLQCLLAEMQYSAIFWNCRKGEKVKSSWVSHLYEEPHHCLWPLFIGFSLKFFHHFSTLSMSHWSHCENRSWPRCLVNLDIINGSLSSGNIRVPLLYHFIT